MSTTSAHPTARAAAPEPSLRGAKVARVRNITKAHVRLEKRGARHVIVKTVADRPWFCRHLIGGFLVRREGRILERLQGTSIVPRLIERTRHTLVMEWIDGDRLRDRGRTGISDERAGAIEAAAAELHATGFAHGDIGRNDILLRPEGGVVLIDFATALRPGAPPLLGRLLHPLWLRRDRYRVRRLVKRYVRVRREARKAANRR